MWVSSSQIGVAAHFPPNPSSSLGSWSLRQSQQCKSQKFSNASWSSSPCIFPDMAASTIDCSTYPYPFSASPFPASAQPALHLQSCNSLFIPFPELIISIAPPPQTLPPCLPAFSLTKYIFPALASKTGFFFHLALFLALTGAPAGFPPNSSSAL